MWKTFRYISEIKSTTQINGLIFLFKNLFPGLDYGGYPNKRKIQSWMFLFSILTIVLMLTGAFGVGIYLPIHLMGDKIPGDRIRDYAIFLYLALFCFLDVFTNSWLIQRDQSRYVCVKQLQLDAKHYFVSTFLSRSVITLLVELVAIFALSQVLGRHLGILCLFSLLRIGLKLFGETLHLAVYRRWGFYLAENELVSMGVKGLILGGIGWLVYTKPIPTFTPGLLILLGAISLVLGFLGIYLLSRFDGYYLVFNRINRREALSYDATALEKEFVTGYLNKDISDASSQDLEMDGFEFLNRLFFQRHYHSIEGSNRIQSIVILVFSLLLAVLKWSQPEIFQKIWLWILNNPGYLLVAFMAFSTGAEATKVMFMSCDYSLLHYHFYRTQKVVFLTYLSRLYRLIGSNLKPALTFALVLFGGGRWLTGNWQPFLSMGLTAIFTTIFFATHYLFLYYFTQPYSSDHLVRTSQSIFNFIMGLVVFYISTLPWSAGLLAWVTGLASLLYLLISILLVQREGYKKFRIW